MKTYKLMTSEIINTKEIGHIIEVYEEVAATKMQRIRADILVSRDFFDGLMKVSEDVGLDLENLKLEKARREAAVFVSANTGLYGDIVSKTFSLFMDYLKDKDPDIFVIGKLGSEMLKKTLPGKRFETVEISDEKIEMDKFSAVNKVLMNYEKISVFYGRFGSIVNQYSHASVISGEIVKEYQKGKTWDKRKNKTSLKYFYEPDVKKVSEFFGNEILTATFEAMLRESQLAKFGSRLMYLDMAIDST